MKGLEWKQLAIKDIVQTQYSEWAFTANAIWLPDQAASVCPGLSLLSTLL